MNPTPAAHTTEPVTPHRAETNGSAHGHRSEGRSGSDNSAQTLRDHRSAQSATVTGNDLLGRIAARIGDDLLRVEEVFTRELESERPYVQDVLTHLTRYRGKRLRPILVLLAADATGGISGDHPVLGAVVEMIHTATLVHDDVLDDATTRRHVATINSRWNNETSVLLGDYLFTHAFHLAASLESAEACRLIGRATNLVCEGELSQIHERGNLALDETTYIDILEGKTGELTAISCDLGARYANASPEVTQAMDRYGRCLGIAFQIGDDLLDLFGDEEQTGKSLGSDLKKQKLTLPVIRLLETASEQERQTIHEWLTDPTPEQLSRLTTRLRQSDAIEYTHRRAQDYIRDAQSALDVLTDSPAKALLHEIAEFTLHRSR